LASVQLSGRLRIWISESIIFNFRIWIEYGVHEKISDPIRLQNFHIRTPLSLTSET